MHHRLIMVTGSGPGAGKSRLAGFLYRQLLLHGIPAEWEYEEDLLVGPLTAYMSYWRHEDPRAMRSLLDAAETLFLADSERDTVHVTDALFPGFYWLMVKYRRAEIEAYGQELAELLRPLRPLIVHLDADVGAAFDRAVTYRGETWGRDFLRRASGWHLPHYHGPPVKTREDYLTLTEWLGRNALAMLREWHGETLVLDTTALSPAESRQAVLDAIGLVQVEEPAIWTSSPSQYAGEYRNDDGSEPDSRLVVSVRDGGLHIDAYWPAGCRLIPEAPDRFRLENTSRVVHFHRGGDAIDGFVYAYRDRDRWYDKRK